MKNHVTVTIGDSSMPSSPPKAEEYVRKVAAYVDGKRRRPWKAERWPLVDGAVLPP